MPLDETLFKRHMAGPGILEVLLKGHLWLELCLNRAIEIACEDPDALRIDRMPFARKVELGQALGCYCGHDASLYRSVNILRNRLAHNLSGEPNAKDVGALEGLMHGAAKAAAKEVVPDNAGKTVVQRLRIIFYSVLWVLEAGNMRQDWEKTYKNQLETFRLLRSLEDKTAANPRSNEELARHAPFPPQPNPVDVWFNLSDSNIDY